MRQADDRFNKRLRARLAANSDVLDAIETQFGIGRRIVDRLRMGLSEPWPRPSADSDEIIHRDALVAPIQDEFGHFLKRYIYHVLDGVTIDNRIECLKQWSVGESQCYFSRKCRANDSIIVCDDVRDLWALSALIQDTSLDQSHVIVAPSQRGRWPESWKAPPFWARWKRVNLATSLAARESASTGIERDTVARELGQAMGRDIHRLLPPNAGSWLAARADGIRYDTFQRLLKGASLLKAADLQVSNVERYDSAAAADLSCCYHAGHLYEATRVLEREEVAGHPMERLQTVVIRSDRTLHVAKPCAAPPGTPKSERVYRLHPDGALLRRIPTPSSDATWRWQSIQAYLGGARAPPLGTLLDQIESHLRSSVWLPYRTDYVVLACVVSATYCQQIFDAVPLVLVTGPKGSGKTELSSAVSRLCANSPGPVGLISAATMTRLVDASHGFVAMDDLERVASSRGDGLQFSDLAQALKLSYKKESAQRMLTDVNQNNQLQRLNFFGIKLINNTRGVDDILGSRMLTVSTRQMPIGEKLPHEGRLGAEQCAQLRDHLHTWSFTHVREIAAAYAEIIPDITMRSDEIFAPLRVLAKLSGSKVIAQQIEEALGVAQQSVQVTAAEAMEQALLTIMTNAIVHHGRLPTVATVLEVQMRLRVQQGRHFGKVRTTDISDTESPEWIGRQFKDAFAPIGAEPIRLEMHTRSTRFYALAPALLAKALADTNTKREDLFEDSNPRAFCATCSNCDYQVICEMREQKLRADARATTRARPRANPAENSLGGEAGLH